MANHAPTASGHDQDAVPGTVFALSTLFTYSEADGLSDIVKFDVQDRTAGGGYLTLNGVKQPENTVFERPTGEIGQWAFVVGPSGSDVVGFNAVDSQGAFNNPSAAATVTALDGGGAQKGIDFQVAGSISASDIAAKGYAFVGNYLGTSSPNYLTEKQANSYIQASLSILSLYEVTFRNGIDYNPNIARNIPGYFDNCLKNNGYIDGKNAYNIANNILHQTPESAIYFAIDASASKGSVYMDDVINYFNGISRDFSDLSNGHPLFKIDVYGGGDVLDTIYDNGHGIAQYKWLADATMWAGSKHYSTYDIAQGLEDKTIFPGIRVDPDVTRGSNFGQWGGSPNPPAPSALAFAVAADKGAAGDTLTVAGKGEVGDTVTLFDGAKAIGTAKVPVGGGWSITTAKPLAIGTHGLSVSEVDVAANQSGASPAQSLSFLGATPNQAVFLGTTGKDVFTGGAGNDVFKFSVAALAATDVVKGGGGSDRLYMTSAGAVHAGRVSGVETYRLANGRANSLTLANANFSGVSGRVITVTGGGNGNTVNAAAATGTNRVTLVGGGGKDVFTGGAGGDTFDFATANLAATDIVKGGGGSDGLYLTTVGTVRAGGVSGVETYTLANLGPNRLTLTDANFAGVIGNIITVKCGSGENTVDASAVTGTHRIIAAVVPSFSTSLRGGAGNDVFTFSPFLAAFVATPTVTGGAGIDTLVLPGNGRVLTGRVSGVEVYRLGDDAAGTLVLANANFAGLGGGSISVYAGKAGDTVDAAALTGTDRVIVVGHAGKDVFTGGAGGDQFDFTAARLAGTDIVEGGAGNDRLYMTTAGTVRAAKVSGVERYRLAGGGGNSLTLANANFAGVTGREITVGGGSGGNTVNAKALTGSNRVVLTGGAGADTFVAARHAAVTGGAGADRFELTTPGTAASPDTVTVADFAHGTDKVGFSKAGFGLGAAPLAETLFKANAAGGFTSSAQRFAYNTTSGALYYDRDGSRTGSSRQLIATLSHHPTLAATDLFFVA